jgi:hypothetical protein
MIDTIDIKKLQDSGADKDVLEVYKLLKQYKEDPDRQWWFDKVYKPSWEAAYENVIWTEDEKKAMADKEQIPLCINDMAKGVQASSAIVTASKPGIEIMPIGSGDLYVAELLKRGVFFVMERAAGQQKIHKWVKHCKVGAMSFLDISYDKTKGRFGKIVIKNAKATNIYFDKHSEEDDLSDVPIIKARLVSRQYIKDNYPDITEDDLKFNMLDASEEAGKSSGVTGKDNYALESSQSTDSDDEDEDDKKEIWEIEAWLLKKVKEYCITAVNPDDPKDLAHQTFKTQEEADAAFALLAPEVQKLSKQWPRLVEKRIQKIVVGKKMISETENPYDVDADGEPIISIIPIIHDETLRGLPVCPSFFALEVSKERNKRRMQSIYVVTKNIDAPLVVQEGYKWVKDKVHGDVLVVDKNQAWQPQRLLPGTTSGEYLMLEKEAHEDIKDIYDAQDVIVGKLPSNDIGHQTVQYLQDVGGMMSRPFTAKLEGGITRGAKVIIAIMLRHWPRAFWERLIEPDEMTSWQPDKEKKIDPQTGQAIPAQPDEIAMKWKQALETISPMNGGNPLEIIDLDVRVGAGSTMPTNRSAKRSEAADMVKAGIYDAEAALEYVDDPYKDQVIARIRKKEEAKGQQAPERINVTINLKDMPPEAQAQLMNQIGIQMRANQALSPDQTGQPTGGLPNG